jgi:hypothetical protein
MLIAELVDHVQYSLGNYYADIGDFSAAGGADINLRRSLGRPLFSVEAGANAHRRVVAGASAAMGARGSLLAGGELRGYDGPWVVPEDLRKVSGMLRYTHEGGSSDFSLQALDLAGREHRVTVGAQARLDRADVTLSRTSARTVVSTVRQDDITQWSGGVYAELTSPWSDVFRTTIGLRSDYYAFDVTSDLPANTGTADDAIVSPKLSLAFGPWSGTELYLSGGLGFHSNDARGAVTTIDPASGDPAEPVDPLVRSTGAEAGMRTSALRGLRSTLTLWTVELDSELLFVGDAGTTEASDGSRRVGVTLANFYRAESGLTADLDVSFTRARTLGVPEDQARIPGALENVIAAGLGYEPEGNGPLGALRRRRFGSYPLIEDASERARANSLLNLNLGYRLGGGRLDVAVLNLLDEEHSDVQYFYTSRLPGEPVGGVDDVHSHPLEPRQLRVSLSWGL